MAPEGKEVEELMGKEILQALRKKVPVSEYSGDQRSRGVRRYDNNERREYTNREQSRESSVAAAPSVKSGPREIKKMNAKEKEKIKDSINDLIGTKGAIIFNDKLEVIRKVPIARLGFFSLDEEPYVVAIDGTATPRVVEACEKLRCHNLIASNFVFSDTDINLVSI